MTRTGCAFLLVAAACGRSRAPKDDAPLETKAPARNAAAECVTIFDRAHAKLAPVLAKLEIRETAAQARAREPNVAGLVACGQWNDLQRTCLLGTPGDFAACKVEPPFVLFDGATRHDALLGAKVSPEDSAKRVAALAGTWLRPATGLDESIQWKISPTGGLAVKRTSKQGKRSTSHDEPPHQLEFVRERQLAFKTGTSTQFVPVFVDGDRIYVSWTSGALAIPISSETDFVLDDADHDRWVIRHGDICQLVDPKLGASTIACGFEGDAQAGSAGATPAARRFVYHVGTTTRAWEAHGSVLVHPAMEVFTKQPDR